MGDLTKELGSDKEIIEKNSRKLASNRILTDNSQEGVCVRPMRRGQRESAARAARGVAAVTFDVPATELAVVIVVCNTIGAHKDRLQQNISVK
jgi:hypothetical protein